MTYCVAVAVNAGMVFCSDSRTNAGIDQFSTYSKMVHFGIDGQRQFVIMSAGNLATSQATVEQIQTDLKNNATTNLKNVSNLADAADYIGDISLREQERHSNRKGQSFEASFIIGGQIANGEQGILMVYPEGNHITTSSDTPYLQIGESKYGKPILDRILNPELNLETAAMCSLVSMDSTMRSNLSVGPPIEAMVYRNNSLVMENYHRFEEDSDFIRDLKRSWDSALKDAFRQMPPINWAANWDKSKNEQNEAS